MGRHHLYFLLYPPPAAGEAALRLAWRLRREKGLTGAPAARMHVSMNAVGAFEQAPEAPVVDRALAAGSEVAMGAFRLAFNRVECWSPAARLHPWVLAGGEVVGADLLYGALDQALAGVGLGRRRRGFNPHMTLLRDARERPAENILPLAWTVEDFALVHSPRGEGRHEVLGRWRLAV